MGGAREQLTMSYTQYVSPDLANQKGRKLGVFDRKLDEKHSIILLEYTQCNRKRKNHDEISFFSFDLIVA